jgi:hypothetical protein
MRTPRSPEFVADASAPGYFRIISKLSGYPIEVPGELALAGSRPPGGRATGSASCGPTHNHIVPLATLPSQRLPANYAFSISLQNDSSGNITGATSQAFDDKGNSIGKQTITLLSLTLVSGGPVNSADLAPIVSFQVDFVDYLNGGTTLLSSGAGTITIGSSKTITVESSEPSSVDWDYSTVEKAAMASSRRTRTAYSPRPSKPRPAGS